MKFTHNWSARSVYYHQHRDDIVKEAAEDSGIAAGHPGYLGALQRALSHKWNNLSLEDREPFQAMADEWSSGKAPDDVKCK